MITANAEAEPVGFSPDTTLADAEISMQAAANSDDTSEIINDRQQFIESADTLFKV